MSCCGAWCPDAFLWRRCAVAVANGSPLEKIIVSIETGAMNIVITGANRGIGLELCRLYQKRGDTVFGVCRSSSEGLDKLGVQVLSGVDVTDEDSVKSLPGKLAVDDVHLLINNAGILQRNSLDSLGLDSIRKQFEVNSVAPIHLSAVLRSKMAKGGKIGLVTSRMGSIADNTSGGSYGYRMSKAALNIAGVSLAHDLKGEGVAVALLHPGFVRTDMTKQNGQVEPADAAAGIAQRLDALSLETSGHFWHANGEELPW